MDQRFQRKPVIWCGRCRRPDKTLVYLSDGQHYCWDCAEHMHRLRGLVAVGKRSYDIDPWS